MYKQGSPEATRPQSRALQSCAQALQKGLSPPPVPPTTPILRAAEVEVCLSHCPPQRAPQEQEQTLERKGEVERQ